MNKEAVTTLNAPQAIGPYSQAIKSGNLLFCSGQIALDPSSGQVVGKTVQEQTDRVMKNLLGILESQGLGFSHVVKTTIFLKSMNDFPVVNETYQKFLSAPFPARATIEVSRLPKDVLVEIDAIATFH